MMNEGRNFEGDAVEGGTSTAGPPRRTGALLAIDFGERRVGLAWCSSEGQPTALATVLRNSDRQLLEELENWAERYDIGEIVLGLPVGFDGQRGENCKRVESFARKLSARLALPLHLWQETLTTVAAQERLERLGLRKFRPGLDAMSAQILLEDFVAGRTQRALAEAASGPDANQGPE